MSPATLSAPGGPADATAAAQRVQQLQALVAQAQQGGGAAGFAAALDAASGESNSGQTATTSAVATAAGWAGSQSPAATRGLATAAYPAASGTAGVSLSPTGYPAGWAGSGSAGSKSTGAGSQSSASTPYDAAIAQAAARYNIDPAILHGLIQQESGFDPNAHSSAGALGLTQLMPGTASSLGVANPLDPTQSIEGGARYLSEMLSKFGGNTTDALAAYNAGPGAVSHYGGVPPYAETQEYVNKVLGYANAYRQSLTTAGSGASSPPGSIA